MDAPGCPFLFLQTSWHGSMETSIESGGSEGAMSFHVAMELMSKQQIEILI